MPATISVCNAAEYQHYKTRHAPWVKLYSDILSSETWMLGTDVSRLLQVGLTLLAQRYGNAIPFDTHIIVKFLHLDADRDSVLEAIKHLARNNFIKINGKINGASKALATRKQVARGEGEGEGEGEGDREGDLSGPTDPRPAEPGPVDRVFQHWQTVHNKKRSALDDKRRRIIVEALKRYDEATLCQSIAGILNSPHHMGQNDRNTKYVDIEHCIGSAKRVDHGLECYERPPSNLNADQVQRRVVGANWQPRELRNASK